MSCLFDGIPGQAFCTTTPENYSSITYTVGSQRGTPPLTSEPVLDSRGYKNLLPQGKASDTVCWTSSHFVTHFAFPFWSLIMPHAFNLWSNAVKLSSTQSVGVYFTLISTWASTLDSVPLKVSYRTNGRRQMCVDTWVMCHTSHTFFQKHARSLGLRWAGLSIAPAATHREKNAVGLRG